MSYKLQRRIMGPILAILKQKATEGGYYSDVAIRDLTNLKDRHMIIESKARRFVGDPSTGYRQTPYKSSRYKIRGTIFSGFWGTYIFNTIMVATMWCSMLD
jgi:hypothetical protein